MTQQNPRLVGKWTVGAGATVELLSTNTDAGTADADGWPTAKCNVQVGATTLVPFNLGFGKTTPATAGLWIPYQSGEKLVLNSISNIGAATTGISKDSIWANNPNGASIVIYAFATNESV